MSLALVKKSFSKGYHQWWPRQNPGLVFSDLPSSHTWIYVKYSIFKCWQLIKSIFFMLRESTTQVQVTSQASTKPGDKRERT